MPVVACSRGSHLEHLMCLLTLSCVLTRKAIMNKIQKKLKNLVFTKSTLKLRVGLRSTYNVTRLGYIIT